MNIVLFGKDGQLGWELQRSLASLGVLHAFGRSEVDLTNPNNIKEVIARIKPDFVVNAAAYTAVDKAEQEKETCFMINTHAVALMAEEVKKYDGWLVHYSTDYVFDGKKETPYLEEDTPNPLSVYGDSKYQSEQAIEKSGVKHLVFRTSWIYGLKGKNFAKTILKLAGENDELKVVDDQVGTPTSAAMIADVTALAISKVIDERKTSEKLSGIYNLTSSGETSWHEYALYILQLANKKGMKFKLQPQHLIGISSHNYSAAAKRPLNSCLNTDKIKSVFGVTLPGWQSDMKQLIEESTSL